MGNRFVYKRGTMSRYTEQSDAIRAIISNCYEKQREFTGDTPYVDKFYAAMAFKEIEELMEMSKENIVD